MVESDRVRAMQRLLFGAIGALLLVVPSLMAYSITVPVPQYRTRTFADYHAFFLTCLTVYGGAAIGILVQWQLRARERETLSGGSVFLAGATGAVLAVGVALTLASIDEGPGNLWGLVVILGGVFGAIVGAGAGLVWHALQGSSPRDD
jgi:predicted membrane channel-forming protein YqfA (hemolysin III family)